MYSPPLTPSSTSSPLQSGSSVPPMGETTPPGSTADTRASMRTCEKSEK